MKIIIVGCGKIGMTLISSLSAEGHDVVAIDNNASTVAEITNTYDVMSVCGNGVDCETLIEADVEKAELVVSTTGSDELNMLCCFMARKLGAKHAIARIRNPEFSDRSLKFMRHQLNLSLAINPEYLAAQEIFSLLKFPSAAKIETFSGRNFEIVELPLKEDSKLIGMSLSELRKKYKANFLVCAVHRGEDVYIPSGNFVLEAGDKIGITASPAEMHKFFKMLDIMKKQARSVMILGASKTAVYLAKMLLSIGASVKIIDNDRERCREVSDAIPGAVVIWGDGAQQEIMLEEGVGSVDGFVSLTGMDEQNILISLLAQSQNVPKVITKVNREEFMDMAAKLGLDCTVSPKHLVSDILVRYARALHNSLDSKMEKLYKLMDGKVEALEFNIGNDCPIINIPLRDMALKDNILIAGILRGRKPIIPSGNDMLLPDDKVVVLAAGLRINDLTDIMR